MEWTFPPPELERVILGGQILFAKIGGQAVDWACCLKAGTCIAHYAAFQVPDPHIVSAVPYTMDDCKRDLERLAEHDGWKKGDPKAAFPPIQIANWKAFAAFVMQMVLAWLSSPTPAA